MNIIEYIKLSINDEEQIKDLINKVMINLENKDFFIPIESNEIENFFDKHTSIVYGAFDGDKLVGMAKLEFKKDSIIEVQQFVELENYKVAKIGKYLVLQEYRNKGIMSNIQKILINEAKKLNYEYVVVIVHPDNIASNKVLQKGEMIKTKTTVLKNDYYRNIYVRKI